MTSKTPNMVQMRDLVYLRVTPVVVVLSEKDEEGRVMEVLLAIRPGTRLNLRRTGSIRLKASIRCSRVLAPVNTTFPLLKMSMTSLGLVRR